MYDTLPEGKVSLATISPIGGDPRAAFIPAPRFHSLAGGYKGHRLIKSEVGTKADEDPLDKTE